MIIPDTTVVIDEWMDDVCGDVRDGSVSSISGTEGQINNLCGVVLCTQTQA